MDDYWLNLAVYKFEDFLKTTKDPHYEGDFIYGRPMKGHSWHQDTWADFMKQGWRIDQSRRTGGREHFPVALLTPRRIAP